MDLFEKILEERKKRFLGFFRFRELKFLQELLRTDLGVRGEIKKNRPFVGWYEGNDLIFCLLTKKKNPAFIDLRLCERKKKSCKWIGGRSYLFYDKRRGVVRYRIKEGLIDFVLCGRCKNLEHLEKLEETQVWET